MGIIFIHGQALNLPPSQGGRRTPDCLTILGGVKWNRRQFMDLQLTGEESDCRLAAAAALESALRWRWLRRALMLHWCAQRRAARSVSE